MLPTTTPLASPIVILYIVDFLTSSAASICRRAGIPSNEMSPTSYSPGPENSSLGVESTTENRSSVTTSTSLFTETFFPPTISKFGSNTTRSFFVVIITAFAPLYSISNIPTPFSLYFPYLLIQSAYFLQYPL